MRGISGMSRRRQPRSPNEDSDGAVDHLRRLHVAVVVPQSGKIN
jgi:hypothetical protein